MQEHLLPLLSPPREQLALLEPMLIQLPFRQQLLRQQTNSSLHCRPAGHLHFLVVQLVEESHLAVLTSPTTATLATTGFDAAPYLFGGLALALTGGALMLIARRKQSN